MKSLAAIAVAVSLSGSASMQAPAAVPQTPQECVKAGRDFAAQKQREAGRLTLEAFRAIDAQRIEMVKACGARFDLEKATGMSKMTDGKDVPVDDPVEKAFAVSGIPQINVIDAKGNIRLIMIGYDDANEAALASFIENLLKGS